MLYTSIMDFLKKYAGIAVLLLLIGGAYFFPKSSTVSFGSAIPSTPAVFETYLANSQGSTDTSFTLASASLRDGTSLSGYNCFTIDSNTPTLEYECGTVSGTTVSNVTRGIDAVTGTTTVASLQFAHRRGADVKITDYPLLTILGRMANGQDTYPNLLQYANTVLINSLSASTTLATKYYVDQTAVSGAPNASPTVKGIVQFATGLQAASSTATGSTGALLALGNGIATDTPSVPQSVSGSHVLMTTIGGFLKQTWLDLSANWTFTGNVSVPTTNTAGGFSPPGSITAYASTTPPSGWLLANGQAVSRTTYANLYSVIGTQYGVGDGSTTFNVPNLAGSMILMASSTNGISSTLGASGGATTTTIAQANIPNYTLSGTYGYSGVSGTGSTIGTGSQAPNTTVSISSNGSGVPANTISPYFVLEYIIKY